MPAGRVANLEIRKRQIVAEEVVVCLLEGASRRTPTVEVRDRGVGLTPHLMPTTILSLGESNKIDKLYLAGAYGQGGSTVLAFCPHGSLFVSRRHPELLGPKEEDLIGVTFARFNELDMRREQEWSLRVSR